MKSENFRAARDTRAINSRPQLSSWTKRRAFPRPGKFSAGEKTSEAPGGRAFTRREKMPARRGKEGVGGVLGVATTKADSFSFFSSFYYRGAESFFRGTMFHNYHRLHPFLFASVIIKAARSGLSRLPRRHLRCVFEWPSLLVYSLLFSVRLMRLKKWFE